jgi:esterase/lipase superfamily enzyme
MRRDHVAFDSPVAGWRGSMAVYGHFGRPVLVFPAENGRAWDFEDRGMLEAVRWLLDSGRVKLYCIDSFDAATWSDDSLPIEERARRHDTYEGWLLDTVLPWIDADCGGSRQEVLTVGVSLGAFHAVNIALRHADRFPLAIGLSGNYDPASWSAWGDRGDAAYFHNPMDYVAHLGGGHLDWLRSRVSVLLVCGQGQWEDTTGSLDSTKRLAELLAQKDIRHELDLWGHDVPHDWPSWQRQLAHHLPRFC